MTRLFHLLKRKSKWRPQHLQSCYRQDLHLRIKILKWVTDKGVPIKNIVLMAPTVTLWSDACEYVIGGYNDKGMTWLWRISPELHGVLKLNLPELLHSVMSIYMTTQKLEKGSHNLEFAERLSDLVCMHRSSLCPVKEYLHDTLS